MEQNSLLTVLTKHSMGVYHVEFNDYFSNHISHGIIALARLGVDADRVQRFIDWYKPQLETPDIQHDYEGTRIADDHPVQDLLGKRLGYFRLLKHYEELLQSYGSKEKLIQHEFPKLANGMACTALHGLIQAGYAWAAGWDKGVCEGLAYIHYSYIPLVFDVQTDENNIKNFGKGNRRAADVFTTLRQDMGLYNTMLNDTEIMRAQTERNIGTVQYRLGVLLKNQGDAILGYANEIHIPSLDIKAGQYIDVGKLGDWLVDLALQVYFAADRRNDFLLLHGVTGAWSLRNLLPILPTSIAVSCARIFVCVLLGAYVTEDSPKLKHDVENISGIKDASWQPVLQSAIDRDLDEHVYKLVQVCYDMWKDNLGSTSSALYLSAARLAETEPITFCKFSSDFP